MIRKIFSFLIPVLFCIFLIFGCGSDLGSFIPALTPSKSLFNPPFSVTLSSAGSSKGAVAVGDIDRDGKKDLIVGLPNSVNIFTAKGDGTYYDVPKSYSVGTSPAAIRIMDLNNDSYNDLISLNNGSNTMSVLMGSSTVLTTKVDYTTGSTPVRLLTWDLNSDGAADFVVLNSASNTVSVLLGVAASLGTFSAKVDYATGSAPSDFCSADFNQDGVSDLAVLNATDSSTSILLGNANGTFQTQVVTTSLPTTVANIGCGDFNRDGKPDVVFSTSNGGTLEGTIDLLRGKGDGTFELLTPQWMTNIGTISSLLMVEDFNGDSFSDVAATTTASTINFLTGKGDGTFNPKQIFPANIIPVNFIWTDVNGDGIRDWVAIAASASVVQIHLGK